MNINEFNYNVGNLTYNLYSVSIIIIIIIIIICTIFQKITHYAGVS